jgi:hypothetical protein
MRSCYEPLLRQATGMAISQRVAVPDGRIETKAKALKSFTITVTLHHNRCRRGDKVVGFAPREMESTRGSKSFLSC